MKDFILELLTSKNPILTTLGILALIGSMFLSGFFLTQKLNAKFNKYETSAEHKDDMDRHIGEEALRMKLLASEIALQVEQIHHTHKSKQQTKKMPADEDAELINDMARERYGAGH